MPIDPQQEYRLLAASYDTMRALLGRPDAALFAVVPEVSGWTPAHHLYHLTKSNGMSLKVLQILKTRPPEDTGEGRNRLGDYVITKERFMRGKGQAPARVSPPEDLARDALAASMARSEQALAAAEPLMAGLADRPERFPHPALGHLTAAEWLRFIRVHTEHHLAIIDDILAAA